MTERSRILAGSLAAMLSLLVGLRVGAAASVQEKKDPPTAETTSSKPAPVVGQKAGSTAVGDASKKGKGTQPNAVGGKNGRRPDRDGRADTTPRKHHGGAGGRKPDTRDKPEKEDDEIGNGSANAADVADNTTDADGALANKTDFQSANNSTSTSAANANAEGGKITIIDLLQWIINMLAAAVLGAAALGVAGAIWYQRRRLSVAEENRAAHQKEFEQWVERLGDYKGAINEKVGEAAKEIGQLKQGIDELKNASLLDTNLRYSLGERVEALERKTADLPDPGDQMQGGGLGADDAGNQNRESGSSLSGNIIHDGSSLKATSIGSAGAGATGENAGTEPTASGTDATDAETSPEAEGDTTQADSDDPDASRDTDRQPFADLPGADEEPADAAMVGIGLEGFTDKTRMKEAIDLAVKAMEGSLNREQMRNFRDGLLSAASMSELAPLFVGELRRVVETSSRTVDWESIRPGLEKFWRKLVVRRGKVRLIIPERGDPIDDDEMANVTDKDYGNQGFVARVLAPGCAIGDRIYKAQVAS